MPITLDEARDLPQEKVAGAGTEELLAYLADKACTATEIADFLEVKKAGVYTKLKKLEENGVLKRVYKENTSYWYAAEA